MNKDTILEVLYSIKSRLDKEFSERAIKPLTYEMGLWTGKSMMVESLIYSLEEGAMSNE